MSLLSRLFGSPSAPETPPTEATKKKPFVSPTKKAEGFDRIEGPDEMEPFFEALGIHYASRTIFSEECSIFEKTALSDYAEYGKDAKISPEAFESYSRLIREGYRAPIYVKWTSDGVGYGVFAAEDLPAGTLVGEYTGVVTPKKEVKNRTWSWKYPIKGQFIDSFPTDVSLDGGIHGNELRFINHSDDRNTSPVFVHDGTRWVNCYYARKPIPKDRELLVNYGRRYWKTRTKVDL